MKPEKKEVCGCCKGNYVFMANDGTIQDCRYCKPPLVSNLSSGENRESELIMENITDIVNITDSVNGVEKFNFEAARSEFFIKLKEVINTFIRECEHAFKKENMKYIKPKRPYVRRNPYKLHIKTKKYVSVEDAKDKEQ